MIDPDITKVENEISYNTCNNSHLNKKYNTINMRWYVWAIKSIFIFDTNTIMKNTTIPASNIYDVLPPLCKFPHYKKLKTINDVSIP